MGDVIADKGDKRMGANQLPQGSVHEMGEGATKQCQTHAIPIAVFSCVVDRLIMRQEYLTEYILSAVSMIVSVVARQVREPERRKRGTLDAN